MPSDLGRSKEQERAWLLEEHNVNHMAESWCSDSLTICSVVPHVEERAAPVPPVELCAVCAGRKSLCQRSEAGWLSFERECLLWGFPGLVVDGAISGSPARGFASPRPVRTGCCSHTSGCRANGYSTEKLTSARGVC